MSYTKEPYSIRDDGHWGLVILGGDGSYVAELSGQNDELANDDARRIVACVNACAGIASDTLEKSSGWQMAVINTAEIHKSQRDDLLDALKGLYELVNDNFYLDDSMSKIHQAAYDAIQKAESK